MVSRANAPSALNGQQEQRAVRPQWSAGTTRGQASMVKPSLQYILFIFLCRRRGDKILRNIFAYYIIFLYYIIHYILILKTRWQNSANYFFCILIFSARFIALILVLYECTIIMFKFKVIVEMCFSTMPYIFLHMRLSCIGGSFNYVLYIYRVLLFSGKTTT